MTVWDALTWATIAVLGPGVLVICVAVARDLRRLLGRAPGPASPDPAHEPDPTHEPDPAHENDARRRP